MTGMMMDFTLPFETFWQAIMLLSMEKDTLFVFRIDKNKFSLIGEKGPNVTTYLTVNTADMIDFTYYTDLEFEFDMKVLSKDVTSRTQVIQSSGAEIQSIRLFIDSSQALKFKLIESEK